MKTLDKTLSFIINFLLKIKIKLSNKLKKENTADEDPWKDPWKKSTLWVANITGLDAWLFETAEPGVIFDSTKSETNKSYITFEINNDVGNQAVKGLKNLKNGFNISLNFLSSQGKILQSLKYKQCKLEYVDYGSLQYRKKNPHIIKFQCSCETRNFSTVVY